MVSLTAEMKEVFAKNKPYAIATASKKGIPNVTPMSTVQVVADDMIWIGDNYMVKTLANVRENPHLALYIWDPEKKRCFQIKGTVTVKTSGPEYEKIKAQIKAKGPQYPAKGLLILKITEVFDCTPDQMPEKKLNNFFIFHWFLFSRILASTSPSVNGQAATPREGVLPSQVILTSDCLIRYTFSVELAKISVAGSGRRLFWARIGLIPMIFVLKICRCRSITGGKVGSGRGLGRGCSSFSGDGRKEARTGLRLSFIPAREAMFPEKEAMFR